MCASVTFASGVLILKKPKVAEREREGGAVRIDALLPAIRSMDMGGRNADEQAPGPRAGAVTHWADGAVAGARLPRRRSRRCDPAVGRSRGRGRGTGLRPF